MQDRKAELDAEIRQQGLLLGGQQQQQQQQHQLPMQALDDLLLSDPVLLGPPARDMSPRVLRSPAELFPGLNTSTPSGCAHQPFLGPLMMD